MRYTFLVVLLGLGFITFSTEEIIQPTNSVRGEVTEGHRYSLKSYPKTQELCFSWCSEKPKFKVRSGQEGVIEFTFESEPKTPRSCFDKVDLIYVGDKCSKAQARLRKHSTLYSESFVQTENGFKLAFNRVFKGCYRLKFITYDPSTRKTCLTKSFLISSEFKKEALFNSSLVISSFYFPASSQLTIAIEVQKHALEVVLVKIVNNTNCDGSSTAIGVAKAENASFKSSLKTVTCSFQSKLIRCGFHLSKKGNYCALIEFIDERCAPNSVWTDNWNLCRWRTDLGVLGGKPLQNGKPHVVLGSYKRTETFLEASFYIFLALLCCASLLLCKQSRSPSDEGNREPMLKDIPLEEPPFQAVNVLLLYARDCEIIMDIMTEIRTELKHNNTYNVFDLWDCLEQNFIAVNAVNWVYKHLSNKTTKIVLMSTESSVLIHDSLVRGRSVQFHNPHPFDNVFVLALQSLLSNGTDYRRIFVARLPVTDFESHYFQFINPATVFTLPQQLPDLHHILQDTFPTNRGQTQPNQSTPRIEFLLAKFEDFKSDNPDYISEIVTSEAKNE